MSGNQCIGEIPSVPSITEFAQSALELSGTAVQMTMEAVSHAIPESWTTCESLPDLDLASHTGVTEVATCDSLPDLDTASESDALFGLRGTILLEDNWGRLAMNEIGFEVDDVLKLGQFGGVRLMRNKRDGTLVVAKLTVNTGASDNRPLGRREYDLIKSFKHHNIIHPLFFLQTKYETYIFMECCANGCLGEYVLLKKGTLCLAEVRRLGMQIIGAISHLHVTGIVHCAVQPGNVLVTAGERLRLSGFGSCRRAGQDGTIVRPAMSTDDLEQAGAQDAQVAPELGWASRATTQADIWGFGLCCLFMCSGQTTPDGNPAVPKPQRRAACRRWDTSSAWLFWDMNLAARHLGTRCYFSTLAKSLNRNPWLRPSVAEALSSK